MTTRKSTLKNIVSGYVVPSEDRTDIKSNYQLVKKI